MTMLRQLLRNGACVLGTTCLLATAVLAHPGSGIVVDRQGQVYFVETRKVVWSIDPQGRLAPHDGPAFHWMTIDVENRFAGTRLPSFPSAEVKQVGGDLTLILSSDFSRRANVSPRQ